MNQLCTNCILLSNGIISRYDSPDLVISGYLSINGTSENVIDLTKVITNRTGNKKVVFQKAWLKNEGSGEYCRIFSIGDNIVIGFEIKFIKPNENRVRTSIVLKTAEGLVLANMIDVDSNFSVEYTTQNSTFYGVHLNDIRLYPGTYFLSFWAGDLSSMEDYDYVQDCISFEVIDGGKLTNRRLPRSSGVLFLTPKWLIIEND